MAFAFLFVIQSINERAEVLPINAQQEIQIESIKRNLAKIKPGVVSIDRALKRVSRASRWLFVSFDVKNDKPMTNFPPPLITNPKILEAYLDSPTVISITTQNSKFIGPFVVTTSTESRTLFIGRMLPKHERKGLTQGLFISIAVIMFVGSVLCGFLVWSLTKPIKQIRVASQHFAEGKLDERVIGADARKDEIGQLAKDFNTMADEISSLIENQQLLMANISHELRTPLTRMQLALALIQESEFAQVEKVNIMKQLSRIESDIVKMDDLIEQILSLAKAKASRHKLDAKFINIEDFISNILEDLSLESQAKHIEINVRCDSEILIKAEPNLLSSALENIVRNAIKYAVKTVNISLTKSDKYVAICIDDDGNGVESLDLESIFEPFYRSTSANNSDFKGTGLGLAIAKANILANEGSINAQTSDLGGLKVVIEFPYCKSKYASNETVI